MEQTAAKTKAAQTSPAGTFSMKLGKTTYMAVSYTHLTLPTILRV